MKKQTGEYVDGFILVVPKNKVSAYKKMATLGAKIWKKHGALDYKECMGDDLSSNMGGMSALTFPKIVKVKKNETVWFSYITFKSRKHRDQVNAKVMKDPEMDDPMYKDMPMPMDMKRFVYGGFKVIVSF